MSALEHLQPLPPGGIKIAAWGRAGGSICARGSWASSHRPQVAPRHRFRPIIRPTFVEKRPDISADRPIFGVVHRGSRSILNINIFLSHNSSQKIKYFNKIVQQQIVQYKLYISINQNSYFITRRARRRPLASIGAPPDPAAVDDAPVGLGSPDAY